MPEKLEKEILVEEGVAADIPEAVEEVLEATQPAEPKQPEVKPTVKEFQKRDNREANKATNWVPKTQLGKDVVAGKYKTINEVLGSGNIILEPEIIDYLVPNLKQEIIYIGGTPGKGGGIKRTATRITARMHKSGRRYNSSSMVVVGNEDGVVGMGKASSKEHRQAIEKSVNQAKLNVIKVKRGCGSWECYCKTAHSIPYRIKSKHGSVTAILNPAPKGIGIVADKESKKILSLAGIRDVWVNTEGQTSTRTNLASAIFKALSNLSRMKGDI